MSIALVSGPSLGSRIAGGLPWPPGGPVTNATRPSSDPVAKATDVPFTDCAQAISETETCSSHPLAGSPAQIWAMISERLALYSCSDTAPVARSVSSSCKRCEIDGAGAVKLAGATTGVTTGAGAGAVAGAACACLGAGGARTD